MDNQFRTIATHTAYLAYKQNGGLEDGCRLCEKEPLQTYNYWKLVENGFPYDRVASKHTMLIPKRHAAEDALTEAELKELKSIKRSDELQHYDVMLETTTSNSNIPDHYHLHLLVAKSE